MTIERRTARLADLSPAERAYVEAVWRAVDAIAERESQVKPRRARRRPVPLVPKPPGDSDG
jgi:hypothetical protein